MDDALGGGGGGEGMGKSDDELTYETIFSTCGLMNDSDEERGRGVLDGESI